MPIVTSTEMFKKAYEGGYAIGAFNVNNMETIQGIVEACTEENAPVILQVSAGARKYANPVYLRHLIEAASEVSGLPIVMHLDHGDSFELCKSCVDGGFTSVMIDASHHSFEENIKITSEVVQYAHDHGVVVEAELGQLAGIEDAVNVSEKDACYTDPNQVEEFVSRTGVDSLAIAIGTSHGAFKFKTAPRLRFDILEEVGKRLPGFPIVLHGASSIPQEYVETIQKAFPKICFAKPHVWLFAKSTSTATFVWQQPPLSANISITILRTSIPVNISGPQERRLRNASATNSSTFWVVQAKHNSAKTKDTRTAECLFYALFNAC